MSLLLVPALAFGVSRLEMNVGSPTRVPQAGASVAVQDLLEGSLDPIAQQLRQL